MLIYLKNVPGNLMKNQTLFFSFFHVADNTFRVESVTTQGNFNPNIKKNPWHFNSWGARSVHLFDVKLVFFVPPVVLAPLPQ